MPETIVIPPDTPQDELAVENVASTEPIETVTHNPGDITSFIATVQSADFTQGQRRYLIARIAASGPTDACRSAGCSYDTMRLHWRKVINFALCEQQAANLAATGAVDVARVIAQRTAPLVMLRQTEQATASHADLTDRQLMAQQRARDAVLRAAGLDQPPEPRAGTSIDEMALVLFRRIRTPALPSPSDS